LRDQCSSFYFYIEQLKARKRNTSSYLKVHQGAPYAKLLHQPKVTI